MSAPRKFNYLCYQVRVFSWRFRTVLSSVRIVTVSSLSSYKMHHIWRLYTMVRFVIVRCFLKGIVKLRNGSSDGVMWSANSSPGLSKTHASKMDYNSVYTSSLKFGLENRSHPNSLHCRSPWRPLVPLPWLCWVFLDYVSPGRHLAFQLILHKTVK